MGLAQSLKRMLIPLYLSYKKGAIRRTYHYVTRGHLVKTLKIWSFLKGHDKKKVQVGCGPHTKEGWLNCDLLYGDVYLNACKRLPFPENSIDYFFAEQFIEHISIYDGTALVNEIYRVLKPGGAVRFGTPDLDLLIRLYKDENTGVELDHAVQRHRTNHNPHVLNGCHFFNDYFRLWGHQFIYNYETLYHLFKKAGFSSIDRKEFGSSDYEALNGLERHADTEWMKNAYQIFIEAKKDR